MTNGGNALHRLNTLPVRPVLVPMKRGVRNVAHAYSNFRCVKAYCEENAIQLIHTHHRYPELVGHFVSKTLGLRTVTTAHSIVEGFKSLSFKSDRIIAISNAVRETLVSRFGVEEARILTMYNCIEAFEKCGSEELGTIRKSIGIPENHKVILYVGRFDAVKGVRYLIHAFKKINDKFPDATLLLIGDTYRSFDMYGDTRIKILPPQENISQYYQLSDLVVLPSKQESLGYVMLEAGIAGKPFIGSQVGGIAEFIEDGRDGLLFPARDVGALASRILEVLNDESTSALLGANLRRKVGSLPTCEQYCTKLDELYRNLLT